MNEIPLNEYTNVIKISNVCFLLRGLLGISMKNIKLYEERWMPQHAPKIHFAVTQGVCVINV